MFQFDEGFIAARKKLQPREWVEALTVATDVMERRIRPGGNLEQLHHGGRTLWSARVNDDIRVIFYHEGDLWVPLYVAHHEEAYRWASTRRTRRDARTGAVTIIHETAAASPAFAAATYAPPGTFDNYEDTYLLSLGVSADLLPALRHVRTDDDLLNLALGLPADVSDRLLVLANGELVTPSLPALAVTVEEIIAPPAVPALPPAPPGPEPSPTETYQPLRLFDVDDLDLKRMLAAPMEAWVAFLHPSQRGVATRSWHGAAKIAGGAGTGKTVVAMHRARHLARQGRRVLLASFTNNACTVLERGVTLICDGDDARHITVRTVHSLARDIARRESTVTPPANGDIRVLIERYGAEAGISADLAEAEWQHVIQALGITTWEEYRDARRSGRGARLSIAERERLWDTVILPVDKELKRRNVTDWPDICQWARRLVESGRVPSPFDAVIVDETQDLGPQELRLLAALAGDGPDCLTLVGDGGQRIYPNHIRLTDLGIDVRGRTRTLSLNYRTTEQIHRFAEALLDGGVDDLDGGRERRRGTHSLFTGPEPTLRGFDNAEAQHAFVAAEIIAHCARGVAAHEIAIVAPTSILLPDVRAALMRANIPAHQLSREATPPQNMVTLATIHRAKGMEFRVVFVVGASDDYLARHASHDPDEQVSAREQARNLLYVAATRARDDLYICWTHEPSRFLRALLPVADGA